MEEEDEEGGGGGGDDCNSYCQEDIPKKRVLGHHETCLGRVAEWRGRRRGKGKSGGLNLTNEMVLRGNGKWNGRLGEEKDKLSAWYYVTQY